ncbi:DMT family transporter [Paenibacillus sp. P26]|nr:DMT family transporter [Paenibacillus sp. P26]
MGKLSRTQTILLIIFLVTIWGINWPLSKFALKFTPPVLFSGIRTLLGGMILLVRGGAEVQAAEFSQDVGIYLLSALFNVVLYYGLQTIGLNFLPSGLFSAIVFLQPVLVGIFSWMWLGEPMFGLKIAGLILGFTGVGIISTGGLAGHISLEGILLALGSALSWALGTVYVKKNSASVDPIWLVTFQLIAGGLFMTILGSGVESWSAIAWKPVFILCLLFISLFVIALGWLAFYKLIGSGEASRVASYTFLIPIVAILTGDLFLHEPLTLTLLAGLVMILVSIYFVNRTPGRAALKSK